MSLLTDPDFLLQSLRLNYIRHVLPNHAVQSSLPGTGPYNLIAFDAASPTLSSPYVVASGLADEPAWPELASGRSSPPLGLARGRSTAEASTGPSSSSNRRRGLPGTLQYSQTIGKVAAGAGMRVGGRARSWKGRGAGQLDTTTAEESVPGESGRDADSGTDMAVHRRKSLETSIHHRRLGVEAESIASATPPPVVIHSPVRTPQDSPVSETHPDRTLPTVHDTYGSGMRVPILDADEIESPATSYDGPDITPSTDRFDDDDDDDRFDESPLDFPSRPLSHIQEDDALSTSASSPLAFGDSGAQSEDSGVVLASSLLSSRSASSLGPDDSLTGGISDRYASVASSGVSLFGVSRVNSSNRDRSDSDSSLAAPVLDKRVGAIAEESEGEEVLVSELPPTPPPQPRVRAARERRRVNISGRQLLVPIAEPVHDEEDTPPPSAELVPHPAVLGEPLYRPRSNTDPELLAVPGADQPAGSPLTDGARSLRKKASAPSLLGPSTTAPSSAMTTPQSAPVPMPSTPASLVPPTPSHRNHSQPLLTFPSRATSTYTRPPLPQRSALSALLSSKSDSPSASNPFSALYASLASRATDALSLSIYFPHSKTPSKALKVKVKKDLSVEEVIGAGLWSYWEEGHEPKLEVDQDDPDETTKWNLRIVEDDGEVDEDFPALDRTRAISAFSFDEFAIVKAAPQQIKDNKAKQATIQRRPSRVLAPPKRNVANALAPPPLPTQPSAALTASSMMLGAQSIAANNSSFRPGTMAVSSALAVPVLLKVRLPPLPGVEAINTTINVPNDMYMSDVLDHICKKRGIESPKDWALVVEHDGEEIVVPLDRTVNSLGDRHQLNLVKRSQIASLRGQPRLTNVRTNVNPSASIFKRLSEPPQPKYQSASDLTSAYQRYTVQRKLPMPLGRHPRTIAIDGDYIHFMPSDSKGMLSGGRTSSFHISNVHDCKVSRRAPSSFKLLVQKDRVDKRYDFEADSPKAAAEIVAHVRLLMAQYDEEQRARAGR